MKVKESERLIVKFITNQATPEEINMLTQWLETPGHQKVFQDFVKVNYAIDYNLTHLDSKKAKKQLLRKIKPDNKKNRKRSMTLYYKYAAVLILGLGIMYWLQNTYLFKTNTPTVAQKNNIIIPKEEAITLLTDNGSKQFINLNDSKSITDKSGKIVGQQYKNKISYSGKSIPTLRGGKIAYNTLIVPFGKRFVVELSDGTLVHLNSGTSLRYPVKFLKKHNREVFLIGEAYFEVSKDKTHPFTVNTQEIHIEVLGTKFNVNSYKEDATADIVLVEGKVALYKNRRDTSNWVNLTPGIKGSSTKGKQNIITQKVNTDCYTAWLKGDLVFKNISFDNIIKKLERHYNVTIINKNKTIGTEIFNARFNEDSINTILENLSESFNFYYTIENNTVIIH